MSDDALDFIFELLGTDVPKLDDSLRWHEQVAIVGNYLVGGLLLIALWHKEYGSWEPYFVYLFVICLLIVYHYMIIVTARLRYRMRSRATTDVSDDWYWTNPKRIGYWLVPGHLFSIILWLIRWSVVPVAIYIRMKVFATRDTGGECFMPFVWLLFAYLGITMQLMRIMSLLPPKNRLFQRVVP